jgi:hypothetical protein
MNRDTVLQITVEDLGMRKLSTWMVSQILTDDQRYWIHILSDLLHNAKMFDRVIICDEKWCFQYDTADHKGIDRYEFTA